MIIMKKIVGLLLVLSASSNVLTANYNDSIVTMGLAFNAVFFAGYAVYTTPNDVSIPIGIGAGLGALLTGGMAIVKFLEKHKSDAEKKVYCLRWTRAENEPNKTEAQGKFREAEKNSKQLLIDEILFGSASLALGALSTAIMIKNNNYYIAPAALFSSFALARIL